MLPALRTRSKHIKLHTAVMPCLQPSTSDSSHSTASRNPSVPCVLAPAARYKPHGQGARPFQCSKGFLSTHLRRCSEAELKLKHYAAHPARLYHRAEGVMERVPHQLLPLGAQLLAADWLLGGGARGDEVAHLVVHRRQVKVQVAV